MISVVVPAHNEAELLGSTLSHLLDGPDASQLEVIVVCNGCTDETAAIARQHGAHVVELAEPSKSAALNAGDRVAKGFPRFYVDADIGVTATDLVRAASALRDGVHGVSPRMIPDLDGRPWMVRAFFDVWLQLPYCKSLIGSGVYGLDEVGRSRFDEFPPVIADDLFARLHLRPSERRVVESATFTLRTPRKVAALVRVKTRSHLGWLQLKSLYPELFANEDADHHTAIRRLVRHPGTWSRAVAYIVIRQVARSRARLQHRRGAHGTWERDETTRTGHQARLASRVGPPNPIKSHPLEGRIRLAVRWIRFAGRSARTGDWDFVRNAVRATTVMIGYTVLDAVRPRTDVTCNICGWSGRRFYPNTGPGYDEQNTTCPGCRGIDRHRTLLAVMTSSTHMFDRPCKVVEVAPMRGFERRCLNQPELSYTSFDLERHALEQGDITALHYADDCFDFFICFHVLEHIPDEHRALSEMLRVLKPGGIAVLQVPIDWSATATVEYGAPDPRDVGHVRRYGADFPNVLSDHGFDVSRVDVSAAFDDETIDRFGLSSEPLFFAAKPCKSAAPATADR